MLRDKLPDHVPDDIEVFEDGDTIYGRDKHGEFRLDPMTGASEPQDGRCSAVVKYSRQRYGETRYCTAMPVGNFPGHDYEHDEFCRHHQMEAKRMEHVEELFEHGYFATNYVNFAKRLPPSKFIFAVEIFRGLIEQSNVDFDVDGSVHTIDTSEAELIGDEEVAIELPVDIPEQYMFQANELWTAALKQVQAQNMQEVIFTEGMEKDTIEASADMEGQITDTHMGQTEHHLHLPLSRVAKDIKEHIRNGGVVIEDDGSGAVVIQNRDYTMEVTTDETDSDGAEDVSDVAEDFTQDLQVDDQ